MKTFFNLIQEVQKPGLCHHCGACVSICSAVNYGALELDEEGKPRYKDIERCIECGLCYSICPEISELEEETKKRICWSEPIGRILSVTVARAISPEIRKRATDGGVVTGILLHLMDIGRIDGAIVAKQIGPFQREPYLATTKEEIIDAAGFFFGTSHGVKGLGDEYMAHASVEQFNPLMKKGLRRVALVATPCQIHAFRRMETLGVVPSDSIKISLGLFCSGNFLFGEKERGKLAEMGNFDWNDVKKVNVKDNFIVHLKDGQRKEIPIEDLEFMKRFACRYCDDYSSQYADISFGGIGAEEGWTTVIARTSVGRAAFKDALGDTIEEYPKEKNPEYASDALNKILQAASKKRKSARFHRKELGQSVEVKD